MSCGTCEHRKYGRCTLHGYPVAPHWSCDEHEPHVNLKEVPMEYDYCQTCNGRGYIVISDDPSPPGISLPAGKIAWEEPCPDCIEKNMCPWCQRCLPTDRTVYKYLHCPCCGWVNGKLGKGPVVTDAVRHEKYLEEKVEYELEKSRDER